MHRFLCGFGGFSVVNDKTVSIEVVGLSDLNWSLGKGPRSPS